jgi:hypothetical protein
MAVSGTRECVRCGGALAPDGRCPNCGVVNVLKEESSMQQTVQGQPRSAEVFPFTPRRESSRSMRSAFLFNKLTSERHPLSQSVTKIGRDETNNISITNDHYISRHHAWVLQMQGGFWVEDLGSTNGTLLNGELLTERRQIYAGDRITFGKTELVFAVE